MAKGVGDSMKEKIRKLAMWKRQYPTKRVKLTLLKNTLSNQPIYMMSLFLIPRLGAKGLKEIQRKFMWGGGDTKKTPFGEIGEVLDLKREGGLGIRKLVILDQALVATWNWWFAHERQPQTEYNMGNRMETGQQSRLEESTEWSFKGL